MSEARQERVKIRIKKDGSGEMSFEAEGFVGQGCDVLKDIEAAMGMVTHSEATAEAHMFENPDPAFNELADI